MVCISSAVQQCWFCSIKQRTAEEIESSILARCTQQSFEPARCRKCIWVEQCDPVGFSRGRFDPYIVAARKSEVFRLSQNSYPWKAKHLAQGTVGTRVVDQNDLVRRHGLRMQRIQATLQIGSSVPVHDHNAYAGPGIQPNASQLASLIASIKHTSEIPCQREIPWPAIAKAAFF